MQKSLALSSPLESDQKKIAFFNLKLQRYLFDNEVPLPDLIIPKWQAKQMI